MNRRNFLTNIGLASGGMAIAPYISFAPIPKRLIHKVEYPTFGMTYGGSFESIETYNGIVYGDEGSAQGLWARNASCVLALVETYKGTLKELCDIHPNDDIFFYKEGKDKIGDKFVSYTRAFVLKKERNIKVTLKPTYEV
jgi:hypothetical protein